MCGEMSGYMKKKHIALILSFLLMFFSLVLPDAADAQAVNLNLEVKSAILVEAETGQVLYQFNADEVLPPASMAKMMTEYLVLEQIHKGKLQWEDIVTTSQYAADVIGSQVLLAVNEQMTVKDMFYALSIYSANDAAVALAEHIAGTEENFANMMNAKAKELGIAEQAHFINSTGLSRADLGKYAPTGIEGETVMSAWAASELARRLISDYPQILEFTKIPSKKFRERDTTLMINWNWMLEGNKDVRNFKPYVYEGLDGLKTGSTKEAGYCFTGTALRNGMRLISVVMGTSSEPKRFQETRKLLDYGFNQFEKRTVIPAKSEVDEMKTVAVKKGVKLEAPVVTDKAVTMVVPKGTDDSAFEIKGEPVEQDKLVAPIQQGDVLGTLTVSFSMPDSNEVQSQQVNMVAAEDVEKASWIRLLFRAIKNFFADMFHGIIGMF